MTHFVDCYNKFHSLIRVWKSGSRINVKIEIVNVLLSVSPKHQPTMYKRLEALLNGDAGEFNPIVFNGGNKMMTREKAVEL